MGSVALLLLLIHLSGLLVEMNAVKCPVASCLTKSRLASALLGQSCLLNQRKETCEGAKCIEVNLLISPGELDDTDGLIWSFSTCEGKVIEATITSTSAEVLQLKPNRTTTISTGITLAQNTTNNSGNNSSTSKTMNATTVKSSIATTSPLTTTTTPLSTTTAPATNTTPLTTTTTTPTMTTTPTTTTAPSTTTTTPRTTTTPLTTTTTPPTNTTTLTTTTVPPTTTMPTTSTAPLTTTTAPSTTTAPLTTTTVPPTTTTLLTTTTAPATSTTPLTTTTTPPTTTTPSATPTTPTITTTPLTTTTAPTTTTLLTTTTAPATNTTPLTTTTTPLPTTNAPATDTTPLTTTTTPSATTTMPTTTTTPLTTITALPTTTTLLTTTTAPATNTTPLTTTTMPSTATNKRKKRAVPYALSALNTVRPKLEPMQINLEPSCNGTATNVTLSMPYNGTYRNITAVQRVVGCCSEPECRPKPSAASIESSLKTCKYKVNNQSNESLNVYCLDSCWASYIKFESGNETIQQGCFTDAVIDISFYSSGPQLNCAGTKKNGWDCENVNNAKVGLRCCQNDMCNNWKGKDTDLCGGASHTTAAFSVFAAAVLAALSFRIDL